MHDELGRQRPTSASAADPAVARRRRPRRQAAASRSIVLVEQPQRDDVAADELARPATIASSSDVEVGALDDRALDLREPLQQLLAAAQRVHELERPDGLGERLRHPAQQRRLLAR